MTAREVTDGLREALERLVESCVGPQTPMSEGQTRLIVAPDVDALRQARQALAAAPKPPTPSELAERLEHDAPVSSAVQSLGTPQGAGAAVAPTPSPQGDVDALVEEIARIILKHDRYEGYLPDNVVAEETARAIIAHINAKEPSDAAK